MISSQDSSAFVPYKIGERDIDLMLVCDVSDPGYAPAVNYYNRLEPEEGEHPIAKMIRIRLENDPAYRATWERILQLNEELGRSLEGQSLKTWIELEEALNERSAKLSEEHYNQGVEDGQTAFALLLLSGFDENGRGFSTVSQQLRLVAKIVDRIARYIAD